MARGEDELAHGWTEQTDWRKMARVWRELLASTESNEEMKMKVEVELNEMAESCIYELA